MEDTECLPGNISRKPDIKKQYDGRDYSPPQKWIPDSPGMDEFDSRQFQTFPGPYQTIQILSNLGFGQQTHHHTKPHAHPENDSGPVEKGHLRKPHFHSEGKGDRQYACCQGAGVCGAFPQYTQQKHSSDARCKKTIRI